MLWITATSPSVAITHAVGTASGPAEEDQRLPLPSPAGHAEHSAVRLTALKRFFHRPQVVRQSDLPRIR